jgi:glutamate N-acetyltransferase/amino-acid N-acetyltransferase
MENLVSELKPSSFQIAAEAIMTTDTFPKGAHEGFILNGIPIKINGIAKGSGMIAPNMATMLVFIFSDISIEANILQKIVTKCNGISFNSITVDSDTSTSDSLFVVATGKAKMTTIQSLKDPRAIKFHKYLSKLMLNLAHLVVKDGEGLTKFVEVKVTGSNSYKSAHKVGKSIAESPLVKTAFAGEDPNWGRVVMAIGKSGIKIDKEKISIWFGNHLVAQNGSLSETYNELDVAKYMKNDSLVVTVNLGLGSKEASIYTCDLTYDYISINADYRS